MAENLTKKFNDWRLRFAAIGRLATQAISAGRRHGDELPTAHGDEHGDEHGLRKAGSGAFWIGRAQQSQNSQWCGRRASVLDYDAGF